MASVRSSGSTVPTPKPKTYNRLLDQAVFERDPKRRMAILREAETLVLNDQAVAPLFQYVEMQIFDTARVEGLAPNAWHHRRLELVRVVSKQ